MIYFYISSFNRKFIASIPQNTFPKDCTFIYRDVINKDIIESQLQGVVDIFNSYNVND